MRPFHVCAALFALNMSGLLPQLAVAQSGATRSGKAPRKAACTCPANDYTETTARRSYPFANGKTIVLCGFEEPATAGQETTFSEFVLAVCGQKNLISYWDATKTCHVRASRDTLTLEELETLASSRPGQYEPVVWAYEKLFFVKGVVVRRRMPNRGLRQRYSPATVQQVLHAYETTKGGSGEQRAFLAEQLFVATLTGDAKARTYFTGFRRKFPLPDGEFSEQYTALQQRLAFWDKN